MIYIDGAAIFQRRAIWNRLGSVSKCISTSLLIWCRMVSHGQISPLIKEKPVWSSSGPIMSHRWTISEIYNWFHFSSCSIEERLAFCVPGDWKKSTTASFWGNNNNHYIVEAEIRHTIKSITFLVCIPASPPFLHLLFGWYLAYLRVCPSFLPSVLPYCWHTWLIVAEEDLKLKRNWF